MKFQFFTVKLSQKQDMGVHSFKKLEKKQGGSWLEGKWGGGKCWLLDWSKNRPFYSCVLSYLAMNASEAGGDLALIQTSQLFSCKCQLVSIRKT